MPKRTAVIPDDRLHRELWALALLALAVLLLLSFVPTQLFGRAGAELFSEGNIVGRAGSWIRGASLDFFGVSALLLPVVPAIWAGAAVGKVSRSAAIRWTGLVVGIFLLVPTGIFSFSRAVGPPPFAAGWIGLAIGAPLVAGFGWAGASLLTTFLLAAVCVITLGWNPLRSALSGGAFAWTGVAGAMRRLPSLREIRARRAVAAEQVETPPATLWEMGEAEPEPDPDISPFDDPDATIADPPPARKQRSARPRVEGSHVVAADSGNSEAASLPDTGILAPTPPRDDLANRRQLDGMGQILVEKLATFKIAGEIVGMTSGPVVTQFEVSPAPGVKVARIANLEADLALAMRASSVRIVAPIPGKAAVGVEVPNPEPEMVYFREVIESPAFRNSKAQLPLALGKDLAGRPYVADLAKMPHLLIAGATGSGKSVCVNTIITSLVYRHSPRSLRLLMVDPKMVELSMYNDLPHLRHPVVTDNSEAAGVLKWAVLEMERRYELLSANNVRNLQDFNKRLEGGQVMRTPVADGEEGDPDRWIYKAGPLPYIILIIDELADLMMTVQGDVEKPLALLAQKARAIGIHLILATQRPSVNVITGLIKANFPSRIAFRVSSKVDSRTILDQNGADSLLGNGDMLFLPPGTSDPSRIQGAYLATEDTERLMDWYREETRARRDAAADGEDGTGDPSEADILDIVRAHEGSDEMDAADEALEDRDRLFRDAAELCIQHQGGSTSLLQRRLRIGYGRAARIIDQLHHAGVLGPPDGSKPREVLLDMIQLEQVFPED